MQNFWNERYSQEEYIYGIDPNRFFKENLEKLSPGKILLPAEGEGRNASFAAKLGWEVFAFDSSNVAIEKANKLFDSNNVKVNYFLKTLEDFTWEKNFFDCISLIFVHPQEIMRKNIHQKMIDFLKPGGILILEGFSKDQIKNKSGGPKQENMLFSEKIIKRILNLLKLLS